MKNKAVFGKTNGTHTYEAGPYEKELHRLEAYIASRTVAWKDVVAIVAKVHRRKHPNVNYTSATFYTPPVKTKEQLEKEQYLRLKEKFEK